MLGQRARPVRAGGHWKRSRTIAETSPVAYRCLRHEALRNISDLVGRNSEGGFWV